MTMDQHGLRRGAVWLVATLGAALALAVATGVADSQAALTKTQASKLQSSVDKVLRTAAPGGRQVAPNKIVWARDGVALTLPVPGAARAAGAYDCRRGYACLWQHANFGGGRAEFYYYRHYDLRLYGLPPFTTNGASSYFNNQTGGARAVIDGDWYPYPGTFALGSTPKNLTSTYNDRVRGIRIAG
jgi:Peptidase inhibitor family I36